MRRLALCAALVAVGSCSAAGAKPLPSRPAADVAIFFYDWYGNAARDGRWRHWQQDGHTPPDDLAAAYYPVRGAYSSGNPAVLDAQMTEIAAAGVGQVIVSWWGAGSIEDRRLPAVTAAARAHGLSVAIHIEPYPGRSAASVGADIARFVATGVTRFYVYEPQDVPAPDWAAVNQTLAPGVSVLAGTPLPGLAAAGHFSGLYTYDIVGVPGSKFRRICAEAHALGLLCAPSVGPGYDAARATSDGRVEPRADGATYDRMWLAALRSGADLVTITSYNEWHEGTQIEPAAQGKAGYGSYDGAWGLHGAAAAGAYLARTGYWVARFLSTAPSPAADGTPR